LPQEILCKPMLLRRYLGDERMCRPWPAEKVRRVFSQQELVTLISGANFQKRGEDATRNRFDQR
jgi:hypothetical protein